MHAGGMIRMDVLRQVMDERRGDVQAARRHCSEPVLRAEAAARRHRSLQAKLREGGGTRIVAEVKKASPSAGILRPEYAPGAIAREYAAAGAAGISVLTEPRHFLGGEAHLREVRRVVDLPVLRKDFICDPYQVLESAAWGADVVLLIVAALDTGLLRRLYTHAREIGLEVLVEAHTAIEVATALALPEAILGINSRNLKTLVTDLGVAENLAKQIPDGRLSIAESGIRTREDIVRMESCGYDGFLVGEALLRAAAPGAALQALRGEVAP